MNFTGRRAELKALFVKNRGYWADFWDPVLAINPDFFDAYLGYSSIPWTPGVLEPKVKEFIYMAIDVATTHLYEPGLRIHMRNAIKHGATPAQMMEVLMLCGALGIHTQNLGVPILAQELAALGRSAEAPRAPVREQERLKAEFQRVRGYWADFLDDFVALDPTFFAAYLELSGAPWRSGVLEPKVKELVYIAITSSVTHLYEPALRVHVRQALLHGATPAEILEVFQLTSVLGMHSCTVGVPALVEELAAAGVSVDPSIQIDAAQPAKRLPT